MRISRSRQFKINLMNYESYTFGATVTVDHHDFGHTDEALSALSEKEYSELTDDIKKYCDEMLVALMREEVNEAVNMTDERKSIVHHLFKQPTT